MKIYLARHGEASHPGPGQPPSLTPRGRADTALVSEHLIQNKKWAPSAVWHSPKLRAKQTAEIFQRSLDQPLPPLEERDHLSPDGDAPRTFQEILDWKGGDLLIVSHLPFLPELSRLLLEGSQGPRELAFPTTGVAAFEKNGALRFLWAIHPAALA